MTESNGAPGYGGWRVTSQQEVTELGSNGQFTSGRRIYFDTTSGNSGSVFIPDAMYTPDNVRSVVAAKAMQIDAVGNLQG